MNYAVLDFFSSESEPTWACLQSLIGENCHNVSSTAVPTSGVVSLLVYNNGRHSVTSLTTIIAGPL